MVDVRILIAVVIVLVVAVAVYAYRKSRAAPPPSDAKYDSGAPLACQIDSECWPGTCSDGKCVDSEVAGFMAVAKTSADKLKAQVAAVKAALVTIGSSANTIKSYVINNTGNEFPGTLKGAAYPTPLKNDCDAVTAAVKTATGLMTGLDTTSAPMYATATAFAGATMIAQTGADKYNGQVTAVKNALVDVVAGLADVVKAVGDLHAMMKSISRCGYTRDGPVSSQACVDSDAAAAVIKALALDALAATAAADALVMVEHFKAV